MPHIDLLELSYFAGIEISDVVSLIDAMAPKTFAAGAALMAEGQDDAPPLYVVTKGLVDITRRSSGDPTPKPCLIAQLAGPTLIGEVEWFVPGPPKNTATALTQVHAFALGRDALAELMRQKHAALLPFVLNVGKVACERLIECDAKLLRALGQDLGPGLAPLP